jgi:filamentous hemagglutinin family protein
LKKYPNLKLIFPLLISLIICGKTQSIKAQVIPDKTLQNQNSIIKNETNRDIIEGGAIRGKNLFHSFSEFNVGDNRSVYFANPVNINNILTRVTGNNSSNILGTLGVSGNANLFLINPNGINFGTNAKLDLKGSFIASTADKIIFNNYEDYVSGWAIRLIQITISFGYFFSGLNKIKSSDWRKGIAISNAVIYSNYGKQKLLTLFYPKTLQSKLVCYSVVLFHLFAPILFWCNFTQLFAISFAVLSHLMMMITLRIGHFGPIMILGILSFGANYFLK